MISVGKLARLFGISRSTLLYYDSIGLLSPSARTEAGYRLYDDRDIERLRGIMVYREMGLSLEEIAGVLQETRLEIIPILVKRISAINTEIAQLREQQNVILSMLKSFMNQEKLDVKTKRDILIELGEKAGLNPKTGRKWHRLFETIAPQQHRDFLQLLGFDSADIQGIMDWIERKE